MPCRTAAPPLKPWRLGIFAMETATWKLIFLLSLCWLGCDRVFHLRLIVTISTGSLDKDVTGHLDNGEELDPLDQVHFEHHHCTGSDANANESSVLGYIRNGIFLGQLLYPQEETIFFVENAAVHFRELINFHSIIYNTSAIDDRQQDRHDQLLKQAPYRAPRHHRRRRTVGTTWHKRVCTVHAFADHLFFEQVGGGNIANTIDAMVQHVRVANSALLQADFDFDGLPDQLGVAISRVTIYTAGKAKMPDYAFPASIKEPGILLERARVLSIDDVCMAMIFTSRDLAGTNLGLAYQANPSLGGVCSNKGIPFNILITTFYSNGRHLSPLLTEVTLIHELGHALGASHDSSACHDADDPNGYYAMYPKATPGYKRNNRIFSSCSRHEIGKVLRHRSDVAACLKYVNESYCGNGIVEADEECDCGSESDCDAIDKCCHPRNHHAGGCTVRRDAGYQCSTSKGPCCTDQCLFKVSGTQCGLKYRCRTQSSCSGTSPICPAARPLKNFVRCANGGALCVEGECIGSPCLLLKGHGWSECECHAPGRSCHVCCSKNGRCVDSFSEQRDFFDANISSLLRPGGTPCHRYQGYCSYDGVCHGIDINDSTKAVGDVFHNVFAGVKVLLEFWYVVLFAFLLGPLLLYSWKLSRLSSSEMQVRYQAFKTRVSEDATNADGAPSLDQNSKKHNSHMTGERNGEGTKMSAVKQEQTQSTFIF